MSLFRLQEAVLLESSYKTNIEKAKQIIKDALNKTGEKFRSDGVYLDTKQQEQDFLSGKTNHIQVWRLKQNWTIAERLMNITFGNDIYITKREFAKINNSDLLMPIYIHWIGNYINISIKKSDRK